MNEHKRRRNLLTERMDREKRITLRLKLCIYAFIDEIYQESALSGQFKTLTEYQAMTAKIPKKSTPNHFQTNRVRLEWDNNKRKKKRRVTVEQTTVEKSFVQFAPNKEME